MRPAGTAMKIIRTSRPLYWLVHISLLITGALASGRFSYADTRFVFAALLLTLPFSLFVYAINDYHDRESDRNNPRKGGAFGERHNEESARRLLAYGFFGLCVTLAGFALLDIRLFVPALSLSAVLYYYSTPPVRLKSVPVLDALSGGGVYTFAVAFLGFLLFDGKLESPLYAVPTSFSAAFVLGVVFHLMAAAVDEVPDREQGTLTSAVYFGARPIILFCAFFLAVSLFAVSRSAFFSALFVLESLVCLCFLHPAVRANTRVISFVGKQSIYIFSFSVALLALLKPALIM